MAVEFTAIRAFGTYTHGQAAEPQRPESRGVRPSPASMADISEISNIGQGISNDEVRCIAAYARLVVLMQPLQGWFGALGFSRVRSATLGFVVQPLVCCCKRCQTF